MDILALLTDPAAWAALLTLIVLEVVLGIDNLIFIAILSNKLPLEQQQTARRIGLALALIMRIGLLMLIGWLVTLQTPLFDLGITGQPGSYGEPTFETAFSGRDLILLVGGLFLLWKATKEIHHSMEPQDNSGDLLDKTPGTVGAATATFGAVIAQIVAIDMVFSIDSILTAVGMTDDIPIMIAAVVITVGLMMVAADPLAKFIEKNPTLVMLALAFLVMIGLVLIADGFGFHVPKGYIYTAMAFSVGVELLKHDPAQSQQAQSGRGGTGMSDFRTLSPTMLASPQITVDDVAAAADIGVTLIVNNRPEGESPDQTPGADIAAAAAKAGIAYIEIPVGHSGFSQPQVEAMAEALAAADGKTLAYCRSGTRSTLLWSLARSLAGDDPQQIAAAAADAGYDVSSVRPAMDMLRAQADK